MSKIEWNEDSSERSANCLLKSSAKKDNLNQNTINDVVKIQFKSNNCKPKTLTQLDIETLREKDMPIEFGTSKGLKHHNFGAVRVKSTRHGRQFMNRRGGFNRPLPAERTGIMLNDF